MWAEVVRGQEEVVLVWAAREPARLTPGLRGDLGEPVPAAPRPPGCWHLGFISAPGAAGGGQWCDHNPGSD